MKFKGFVFQSNANYTDHVTIHGGLKSFRFD
jgi:hypothetical protein